MNQHIRGAVQVGGAALTAFALATPIAAALLADAKRPRGGFERLASFEHLVLAFVLMIPAAWILLRILSVRRPELVAVLGQALFGLALRYVFPAGPASGAAWLYGIEAALAYAIVAAAVWFVPAPAGTRSADPAQRSS